MQVELKLEFPCTHLTGLHSPTSTVVVFVPLRTQPAGRVSTLELGVEEHESADFSEKKIAIQINNLLTDYNAHARLSKLESLEL